MRVLRRGFLLNFNLLIFAIHCALFALHVCPIELAWYNKNVPSNQYNIKVAIKEVLKKELHKLPSSSQYFCKDVDALTEALHALILPNESEEAADISLFLDLQQILRTHESLQDAAATLKTRYSIVKKG